MKNKSTIILLVIALLLGGYIYFIEIKKTEKDEKIKQENQKVFNIDQDKIRKITFKNSFGEFVLEKDAQNKWKLLKPIEDLADESALLATMTSISSENFDQVVSENPQEFKVYGLDKPAYSLEAYSGSGETKTLLIGQQAPLNGKIYAMRAGENKVLLANLGLKYQVEKSIKDLRDKRIFRFQRDDIHKINIATQKEVMELKKVDQLWQIVRPLNEVADNDAMQALLSSIDSLRASDFIDSPAENKKYNLHTPLATVSLFNKEDKLIDQLVIGSALQNNAYVKTKNVSTVYQIYLGSAQLFGKKLSEYRDKKGPLAFNKDAVKELYVKNSVVELDLIKKGDAWEFKKNQPDKVVNQLQVSQLLSKLSDLKVAEYYDSPIPKVQDKGRIILKTDKGDVLLNFKWGETVGKNAVVATQKYDKPFGVEASLISTLPAQTLIEDKTVEKDNSKKPNKN